MDLGYRKWPLCQLSHNHCALKRCKMFVYLKTYTKEEEEGIKRSKKSQSRKWKKSMKGCAKKFYNTDPPPRSRPKVKSNFLVNQSFLSKQYFVSTFRRSLEGKKSHFWRQLVMSSCPLEWPVWPNCLIYCSIVGPFATMKICPRV